MAHASKIRAAGAVFAWLLTACGAHHFSTADREAIEALLAHQRDAWNAGDLDGFMAAYLHADALTFSSGGDVARGFDATIARYRRRYLAEGAAMGTLAFEVEEIRPLSADSALVRGGFALSDTPQAGSGIFSLVLQRRPEGWRIVHDHTSAACP